VCPLDEASGLFYVNEAFEFEPVRHVDLQFLVLELEMVNYASQHQQPFAKARLDLSLDMLQNQFYELDVYSVLNNYYQQQQQQMGYNNNNNNNNNNHNFGSNNPASGYNDFSGMNMMNQQQQQPVNTYDAINNRQFQQQQQQQPSYGGHQQQQFNANVMPNDTSMESLNKSSSGGGGRRVLPQPPARKQLPQPPGAGAATPTTVPKRLPQPPQKKLPLPPPQSQQRFNEGIDLFCNFFIFLSKYPFTVEGRLDI
jgi:hypothetical protein